MQCIRIIKFAFFLICFFPYCKLEFMLVKSGSAVKVVYSTDRSKAVVTVLVFVALWFILRGDLFYILSCVILFLCFSVL